jgi:hypothetical protein
MAAGNGGAGASGSAGAGASGSAGAGVSGSAGGPSAMGGAAGADFGAAGAAGAAGCEVARSTCSAYPRVSNVLVLIYNPWLASGQDVRGFLAAPDARALSAALAQRIRGASAGLLSYHIVEARELRAWPPQRAGTMPLNETTFMGGVRDTGYIDYLGDNAEGALNADYGAIFSEQHVCDVVKAKDISEVWLWGAHNGAVDFGFEYFSYRLASDQLPAAATTGDQALYAQRRRNLPDCGRTLWLLGAQYSEGLDSVAKAHRSYNFRTQELLALALRTQGHDFAKSQAEWERFSQYELGPGDGAQVGTPIFPPNAGVGEGAGTEAVAWDYTNLNEVVSAADLWLGYPNLSGSGKTLSCTAWNCSNDGFQSWYSLHLPRAEGTSPSGTCNNWWQYVADPDAALEPCCGAACAPNAALGMPCASDGDCASGHCACAGSSVCVADAVAPCGQPNWSLCEKDADCGSAVCGCNGAAPPKYCLPSEAYSRACE